MRFHGSFNVDVKTLSITELNASIEEMTIQRDKLLGVIDMPEEARIEFFRVCRSSAGVMHCVSLYRQIYGGDLAKATKYISGL